MYYFLECMKKYAVFSGRARRKEYWIFYLTVTIFLFGTSAIADKFGIPLLKYILYLPLLIPHVAVSFRRLHDINKSGLWMLIMLIPVIGQIWFLILTAIEGTAGDNNYGPNPKDMQIK